MSRHTARDDVYESLFSTLADGLQQGEGATAREIINGSGASRRTVIDVLKTLVDRELLVERRERGPTDRGRRERTVYYAAGAIASIGATPEETTSDESDSDESDSDESDDVEELLGDDADELRNADFSDVLADATPGKVERIESSISDVNDS